MHIWHCLHCLVFFLSGHFRTWKGVEKYFIMLSSFATITYIAGLIHNHMGSRVEILEGVFSVVIRSRLLVFAVIGLWVLTAILYVTEAAAKERIYNIGKLPVYIWTVLAAVVILAADMCFMMTNAGGHADKYGSVQRYVHFDDDWEHKEVWSGDWLWMIIKMNLHGMKRFLVMDRKRLVL